MLITGINLKTIKLFIFTTIFIAMNLNIPIAAEGQNRRISWTSSSNGGGTINGTYGIGSVTQSDTISVNFTANYIVDGGFILSGSSAGSQTHVYSISNSGHCGAGYPGWDIQETRTVTTIWGPSVGDTMGIYEHVGGDGKLSLDFGINTICNSTTTFTHNGVDCFGNPINYTDTQETGVMPCMSHRYFTVSGSLMSDSEGSSSYTGSGTEALYVWTDLYHPIWYTGSLPAGPIVRSWSGQSDIIIPPELVSMEVTQAIQDWNNSVPLIENKSTYVRAHLQYSQGGLPEIVDARLFGYRDGAELPLSPLAPINDPGFTIPGPNAAERREDWEATLNFRLPDSWLQGTVELVLKRTDSLSFDCRGNTADRNGGCSTSVSFQPAGKVEIKFVGIQWTRADGVTRYVRENYFNELAERLKAAYPTAEIDYTKARKKWHGSVPPDTYDVCVYLWRQKRLEGCYQKNGCERIYYGFIPGAGVDGVTPGLKYKVAAGYMPFNPYTEGRHTHSHEIGHSLGLDHSVHSSMGTSGGVKHGFCASEGDLTTPDFPFASSTSGLIDYHYGHIPGADWPALGPMNAGDGALVYGLDSYAERQGKKPVLSPYKYFDLMSYCSSNRLELDSWPSVQTYNTLLHEISFTWPPMPSIYSANSAAFSTPTEHLEISGEVDLSTRAVKFYDFSIISSVTVPPAQPSGDYILRLTDASNNIIQEIPFAPYTLRSVKSVTERGLFIISVVNNPAIKKATVLYNGAELASRTASPNPPAVNIVFPNGGEQLTDDPVVIQWNAQDNDDDSLTYTIMFSSDGGSTWEVLNDNWPEQTYEMPLNDLRKTSEGMIKIIASDGFYASSDTSDAVFWVPNSRPHIWALSPAERSVHFGEKPIFFEAAATDKEDGSLSGNAITWKSSLNGPIGNSHSLTVKANDLRKGTHVITATAKDSEGLSDTTTMRILVNIEGTASPGIPLLLLTE